MEQIKLKLSEDNIVGNENDLEQVYVELNYVYSITGTKLLNLFQIYVPIKDRHKGKATEIIIMCEDIAKQRNLSGIWIGPFMTDSSEYLIRICKRRDYQPCMPFGMIKMFNDEKIECVFDDEIFLKIEK